MEVPGFILHRPLVAGGCSSVHWVDLPGVHLAGVSVLTPHLFVAVALLALPEQLDKLVYSLPV